jgi:SAM-dependent methyltransferase
MYNRSASVYDAIYLAQGKDYSAEAQKIISLIRKFIKADPISVLDVGCGTGNHIGPLQEMFEIEGLDNSDAMIEIARKKFPGIKFHLADMTDFEIASSFDVITCLFSAIGYVNTYARLLQTLKTIDKHLIPGGLTIIEPWFGPGILDTGKVHAVYVDEPELKIARMNINRIENKISYLDFHYLVATPEGIENYNETHLLGIFTDDEYQEAFTQAGLEVFHDPEGLDGRGLYIGIKSRK